MAAPSTDRDGLASASSWRLPAISDRALPWLRAAWALLAAAALLVTCAGPFMRARDLQQVYSPFLELGLRPAGGRTLGTPYSGALLRNGVISGSELVRIEDRAVPADGTVREVAAMLRAMPGARVAVSIRTPRGEVRQFRISRGSRYREEGYRGTGLTFSSHMAVDLVMAGVTNLAFIGTALLLFRRRPKNGLAAFLSFNFLLWAATENLSWYTWERFDLRDAAGLLSSLAITNILVGLLLFPDGEFKPRWGRWVAIGLYAVFLNINRELVGIPRSDFWQFTPTMAVNFVALAAVVARYRRTPSGTVQKQQERWLALGLAAAMAWLLVNGVTWYSAELLHREAAQLAIWSHVAWSITYPAFTLSIAGGLLVALLRYRLYDAEAAISRSATFAVLTLAFAAIFAGSAKGLELAFESFLGADTGALPGIVAAILATAIVTPAQGRVQKWASRRFQKELAHLRADLPDCVDDLREVSGLREMLDEVLRRVEAGIRSTHGMILVDGKIAVTRGVSRSEGRRWLASHDLAGLGAWESSDGLFPVRVRLAAAHGDGEGAEWLLLGPRPDGTLYGRDEQDALREIADPVARAIAVVKTREARERRSATDRRRISSALADLAARVERLEGAQASRTP